MRMCQQLVAFDLEMVTLRETTTFFKVSFRRQSLLAHELVSSDPHAGQRLQDSHRDLGRTIFASRSRPGRIHRLLHLLVAHLLGDQQRALDKVLDLAAIQSIVCEGLDIMRRQFELDIPAGLLNEVVLDLRASVGIEVGVWQDEVDAGMQGVVDGSNAVGREEHDTLKVLKTPKDYYNASVHSTLGHAGGSSLVILVGLTADDDAMCSLESVDALARSSTLGRSDHRGWQVGQSWGQPGEQRLIRNRLRISLLVCAWMLRNSRRSTKPGGGVGGLTAQPFPPQPLSEPLPRFWVLAGSKRTGSSSTPGRSVWTGILARSRARPHHNACKGRRG